MKSIDWGKWSAIAEIFGAIAVLATLAYLAIQTRYLAVQTEQNTVAVQASVRQEMLSTELEFLGREIEFPSLAQIGRDGQEMTREDTTRLNAYLLSFLRIRESQWLQYQSGALDERTWQSYSAAIPLVFNQDIRRLWWQLRSPTFAETGEFDSEFVEVVSNLIPGLEQ
jgi:hypothetical protein